MEETMAPRSIYGSITAVCVATAVAVWGSGAAAQDSDLRASIQEAQNQYEEALTKGDFESVASMFTEDAVYLPITGGSFEGRDAILQYLQETGAPQALEIQSTRTERIGDKTLDIGTFTLTLTAELGQPIEGEYVVVGEET